MTDGPNLQTSPRMAASAVLQDAAGKDDFGLVALYGVTMLISAALLFSIQPMFTKLVLPLLGGSPAVWNTSIVFYQALLLGGYLYAHTSRSFLTVRRQVGVHLLLLLIPVFFLPVHIPAGWHAPAVGSPYLWLLAVLAVAVGLPYFVISSTSPLLQSWFSESGHRQAADPFYLYVASNVGSMLALISYPLLIEPFIGLKSQRLAWAIGYGIFAALMGACSAVAWFSTGAVTRKIAKVDSVNSRSLEEGNIPFARRLRWVVLAFVPSSLMLGVTTYLSTEVAPIPLIWVAPLALYLLSFIIVFSRRPLVSHEFMVRIAPFVLLLLVFVLASSREGPIGVMFAFHLAVFFVVAMVCHGRLAADRPASSHVTEFYLWLSLGGTLGGMFNALLAPILFHSVLEYPLGVIFAVLLLPRRSVESETKLARRMDVVLPLALVAFIAILMAATQRFTPGFASLETLLIFVMPAVLCFSFVDRPIRFGLGCAGLLLTGLAHVAHQQQNVHMERSFFGCLRVSTSQVVGYHQLVHSGTIHGMQAWNPSRRREPTTYYTRSGPLGQIFNSLPYPIRHRPVAAVGLGVGTAACYCLPGQAWTFYEIDPAVERIARDARYFTFLQDCAPNANVVLGDARVSLGHAPDHRYGLIIMDAYSSDAVPIHLLTREALELYLMKLAPHGVLAFHITNRFFNLEPMLSTLANASGIVCISRHDDAVTEKQVTDGKFTSHWAVMARRIGDLGVLATDQRWKSPPTRAGLQVWTDDFSSLIHVYGR